MAFTTQTKCKGLLGVAPCPYGAFANGVCRIHKDKKEMLFMRHKKVLVCEVCLSTPSNKMFACGQHAYCDQCVSENDVRDGVFDICPFCASKMEMID